MEDTAESTDAAGGEDVASARDTSSDGATHSDTEDGSERGDVEGDTAADGASSADEDTGEERDVSHDAGPGDTTGTGDGGPGGDTSTDAGGQQVCGGLAGKTCGSQSWCDYPNNSCGAADQQGTCKPKPAGCPQGASNPVCGCDGKTYTNPCMAHAAGVDIQNKGRCKPKPTKCSKNKPCKKGQYCDYAKNSCGSGGATGVCRQIKPGCPRVRDPVCGCDGKTYSNECVAHSQGVDIAHKGKCGTQTNKCSKNKPCKKGEYCDYKNNTCGASGDTGVCQSIPPRCKKIYDPVCGCDGQTYGNECVAHSNGVDVAHQGKCKSSSGSCGGQTCSKKEYCHYKKGTCGKKTTGQCQKKPTVCSGQKDPVCGCDGKTYSNECDAHGQGVNVAHDGKC